MRGGEGVSRQREKSNGEKSRCAASSCSPLPLPRKVSMQDTKEKTPRLFGCIHSFCSLSLSEGFTSFPVPVSDPTVCDCRCFCLRGWRTGTHCAEVSVAADFILFFIYSVNFKCGKCFWKANICRFSVKYQVYTKPWFYTCLSITASMTLLPQMLNFMR